ncbi:MAG: GAF domain-containing protein [Chloroflexi bacterium]|nr:GAF domain-containing protein [Chloroflexota bacterium]
MRHPSPLPAKLLPTMRARMMAAFVLVALLGVGSVGGYGFYQYQRDLHGRVEDQYTARNQVVAREIEITLEGIRADLLVAANVPPIQGIVRARDGGGYDPEGESRYDEWTKRLEEIFAATEAATPRYLELRFLDEQGNELVRVDWDGQQARPIAPSELQNKADRPHFQATMQLAAGQIYVSPLDLSQERGQIVIPYQPTIRLATPIFNRQGERRGSVVLNVPGQAILHRPSTLPAGEGSYIFVTDSRGYYLHHSASPEKEWGGPEDLNTGHSLQEDLPQIAGQLLSGRAGEVYAGPWVIFYQPIQVDPQQGAFLVLGSAVPLPVIQGPVNRLTRVFGGVLFLVLLMAAGAGYFLSGRITAPLQALRQGARQIAGGRFDQRVQAGGGVEISDLADDFNRMAGQLAERYGGLQAEYQRLFENASDSIFIYDLKGRILVVNENAAHRLGYTRDELLRLSVQDLDTSEAAARVGANQRLIGKLGLLGTESAHRRKDGSVMPVEISASLVEYRGQQAVMSFVRDISERKQGEATLQASELKYRQLFENASVGMYRSRLDGSAMLEANRHLCEIFGYSRAEMLASPATLRWANPAQRAEMVRLVREQGVLTDYEIDIVTKGGAVKTCLASIRLYPEEGCLEGTVTDITDRKQAAEALRAALREARQRQAETAALLQGAHAILEYGEFADAARAIFDACKDLLGATGGYVALLSEDGTENHVVFLDPGGQNCMVDPALPMPIRGLRGEAYRTGKTVYHNDFSASAWVGLLPGGHVGLTNVLFAPLVLDGKAIGLLGLANKPGDFTEEDVRLAAAFGALAAIALRNSQTLESLRSSEAETARRNAALAAQNAIAATISQSLDLDTVLNAALDKVTEVIGVGVGSIYLHDVQTDELVLAAQRGLSEQTVREHTRIESGAFLTGRVFKTQAPLVVENIPEAAPAESLPVAQREQLKSWAGVPLQVQSRAVGVLSVVSNDQRTFAPQEVALLQTIGQQIGVAVENARLYAQVKEQRVGELAAIAEVGGLVTAGGNLQATLDTLAEKIARSTGFEAVDIGLYDAEPALITFSALYSTVTLSLLAGRKGTTARLAEAPILQQVLHEKQPLLLDDPQNDPRVRAHQRDLMRRDGIQTVVTMPLLAQGELVGVLDLFSLRRRVFSPEDLSLLTTLADQTAMAIVNAQLYGQVEQRAQELNREVIQQKQYAETVLHSIADGVYTVDRQRVILSWSQGSEAITGYTTAEALGRSCAGLLRHQDESGQVLCDTDRCPFIRVWATGKPVEPEQVFTHCKDGRTIPVSVTMAPIFDETGQSIGAVEVFRDVSKERELVASLQAASRAKTRFLANMSHELRTPLNGILGISQALLQGVYGELNPKQTARLGNVNESGQHLLRLINDLLDVARVEENRLVLEVQPISVADLCQVAVRMLQPAADAKQISLELEVGAGPALIEGDERRLRQVLLNLLSNAVKFTPEQGRVGLTAAGKAGGVEFVVWDTGIGIAAEHQPLLFQPFSQVDDDLARRYQGSGLGLALVKQLIELHGGWVAVESAPGRGSRFHVWLPAKRPPPTATPTHHSTLDASRSTLDAPRSEVSSARRVLIVDDNAQVAQLVQDILENEGYAVVLAESGAEGLAAAHDQIPDLILMDIQLPGMDGIEATRRLKADPATRAIPVVALTASAMPGERERALAAGLDDYLTKPIDLAVLIEAVEKWTRRSA